MEWTWAIKYFRQWRLQNLKGFVLEVQRPNFIVVDKKKKTSKIIDFLVSGDSRFEENEKEKIEKYLDLRRELKKIWNVRLKIIPLVVGSLGATAKQFSKRLKETDITAEKWQVQLTVLLGTANKLGNNNNNNSNNNNNINNNDEKMKKFNEQQNSNKQATFKVK